MKVFTVRKLSDIRRKNFIRGYYDKHRQECPLNVYIEINLPLCIHVKTFSIKTLPITIAKTKVMKLNCYK